MTDKYEKQGWEFPGLGPAQAFILPSYQWMLTRLEAADSRLQGLVTFTITVTLAFSAANRAIRPDISYDSGWFLAAMATAMVIVIAGLVARLYGVVTLADPEKVYDKWLRYSEWEFQTRALYFAGQHFKANRSLIRVKSAFLAILTALFAVELLMFLIWLRCA